MASVPASARMVCESENAQKLFPDSELSKYIVKDGNFGPPDCCSPVTSIPIIDLSRLSQSLSSSSNNENNELEKMKLALSTWGCFQVVAHGIPSSLLANVHKISQQFFALPLEEKQKYGRAVDDIEGYGSDPVLSDKQVLDWSNRMFLKLLPWDSRKLNLWPEDPTDFRKILNEYSDKVKMIIELVLKGMSKSLNLEENRFSDLFGDQPLMAARFNHYPICPLPDLVLGVKAHSDGSGITVLLQDQEVPGLQILRDNQWFRIPIIPHALLVNVGDQMQIISNGIFKSPLHRVTTNSMKERLSLAIFYLPDPEVEIGPDKGLICEDMPQIYRRLKNYAAINFECFQNGKIALETVRI